MGNTASHAFSQVLKLFLGPLVGRSLLQLSGRKIFYTGRVYWLDFGWKRG
jgi:hypothetical protein